MNRAISILSLAVLVAACATPVAQRPSAEAAASAAPHVTAKPQPSYPAVPLTGEIMYELMLAEIAGQRGRLDVSVSSLGRVASGTRDPRLAERATLVALYAKDYAHALASATLWSEVQPDSIDANEAVAEALLGLERTEEAKAQFAKVVTLAQPGVGPAYSKIATALGRHPNRNLALDIMQSLVGTQPLRRESHFALAHLAVRAGNLDLALNAINQALMLSPGWEEGAIFKARVLVSRKDSHAALGFFEDYLKVFPEATSLRLNYARFLIDMKQWDRAREQFKRVTAEAPQDADALYAVALLALQANQFDEARNYLRQHLALNPENDQARLYLGQIAEQRRDYDEAARWYGDVQGEQHQFEANARLAILVSKRGDIESARAHLHNLQPQTPQQRVQLALSEDQILRDARRYDESLKVLSAALDQLPDDGDLLYARALVAEKLDLIELHEADLRKILAKDPNNAHALNALGYTLADRTTRYQEALELIERALKLKPDDPFIMDSMGWVQYRLGNTIEAVRLLKNASAIRADAEISAHLGEVLWVSGDQDAAESVWREALKDTPNNEALLSVIKKFKP